MDQGTSGLIRMAIHGGVLHHHHQYLQDLEIVGILHRKSMKVNDQQMSSF